MVVLGAPAQAGTAQASPVHGPKLPPGSSVVPPEVIARGVPFLEGNDQFTDDLREAVEDSLDAAAEQQITEVDVLQNHLHDDLAQFIYDRLKRRPMVLPVVVEV